MTWVYGWPINYDWAVEYAKRCNLVTYMENPSRSRLYHAAVEYISIRSNIDCVLSCWVGDGLQLVFGLCIDEKARNPERAKIRFSRLPPREDALVLVGLLGVQTQPEWYRYDDGSYNPWDEERNKYVERDSDSDSEDGCYLADVRAEAERRRLAREQGQGDEIDECEDGNEVEEDVEDPDVRSDDGAEGDENEQHGNRDDDHDC
ncbi:hypothetical protein AcW1_005439 [Taiwanofungus camphoratus]|nr:hypothetical protein AcW2_004205 [Antrodia cinnamomea]KAI0933675.1 hypothetical protein AcV5_005763 [Antrodia cinnamomea]KAI0948536.1 hypothetical protein AcV7_009250 [Antrodia cinnamomea]KAI0956859.1 hypothetical protein AcW1_005439 [Antrodia cinnamomea]